MERGRAWRVDAEGLRGIAVLSVVLYHARVPFVPGGYVGVDVFYVLSGFLITGLLWKELRTTGRLGFAAFYARRARRLLPSAALVLLVTVAASYAILAPLRARTVMTDAVSAALYVANYRFAYQQTDYLASGAGPSPVQHYWSLAVEEQYYLLWPLLLYAFRPAFSRRRRRPVRPTAIAVCLAVVTLVSFIASVQLTARNEPWAFFSLPTRAWELGAGGLVCLAAPLLKRLPRGAAAALSLGGLVTVLLSVVLLTDATAFPGLAALAPVCGAAAVLAGGTATARGAAVLLRHGLLQFAGRISYSWYLWHWPVLVLATAAAGHPLPLPTRLALMVIAAVLAVATMRLVENPVRFSPRLAARPRPGLAMAAVLTLVGVAVPVAVSSAVTPGHTSGAVVATAALPHAAPVAHDRRAAPADSAVVTAVQAAVAAGVATKAIPRNLSPDLDRAHGDKATPFLDGCHLSWTAVQQRACRYARRGAAARVVLIGDSHATQWFPGLEAAAMAHGWELDSWTKATCPPLELDIWSPVLHRPYQECTSWRNAMLQRIRQDPPKVVVLGVARHYGPEYRFQVGGRAWLDGLSEMVKEVRAAGSRVVVLGPVPHPSRDIPECLSAHAEDAERCDLPRATAVRADVIAAEKPAVEQAGGRYLDVIPWLCSGQRCPVVVGNLLVYRDDNHLASGYPRWLAPLLALELGIA